MSAASGGSLASTYAEALAQAAAGRGALAEAGERLEAMAKAWREGKELRAFFLSGAIPREAKRQALGRLRAAAGDLIVDFLLVLQRRNRLFLLPEIADAFRTLLDRRLGRVPVVLETAAPVTPSDLEAWRGRLRASIGKEPVLLHRVRLALVGGAVIRVGDVVADGSVRRRLHDLRDRTLRASRERSSHALPA